MARHLRTCVITQAAMHGVKLIWRTTTAGVTLTPLRMQLHKAQVLAAQEVGVPVWLEMLWVCKQP